MPQFQSESDSVVACKSE